MVPRVPHLLCRFHLVNISKNMRPKLRGDWSACIKAYYKALYAARQEQFEQLWACLIKGYPAAADYTSGQFYPVRTQWASAWTDAHTTFNAQSTQPVESMNNVIKNATRPSYPLTDLFQALVNISARQTRALVATLSRSNVEKDDDEEEEEGEGSAVCGNGVRALAHDLIIKGMHGEDLARQRVVGDDGRHGFAILSSLSVLCKNVSSPTASSFMEGQAATNQRQAIQLATVCSSNQSTMTSSPQDPLYLATHHVHEPASVVLVLLAELAGQHLQFACNDCH